MLFQYANDARIDTSGIVVTEDEVQQSHDHATVEQDSPGRRGRRGLSMEQKQVSNREHQRRFRERAKVADQTIARDLPTVGHRTALGLITRH